MGRQLYNNEVPAEALTFLINVTVNGSPERRLAAKVLLDCLRKYRSKAELTECVEELEEKALLDIAGEARQLAASLGLLEA
jgi:hypothetical protein